MHALGASAQFSFSPFPYFGERQQRFGLGMIFDFPPPSPDESTQVAYDFCMHMAVSALISFDDFLIASTASILPASPIAPQELPQAFPDALFIKHSPTTYELERNQCVQGYESFHPVTVDLPLFEHLYAGLMTCEQMYGREQIAHHALCVGKVAEHLNGYTRPTMAR